MEDRSEVGESNKGEEDELMADANGPNVDSAVAGGNLAKGRKT